MPSKCQQIRLTVLLAISSFLFCLITVAPFAPSGIRIQGSLSVSSKLFPNQQNGRFQLSPSRRTPPVYHASKVYQKENDDQLLNTPEHHSKKRRSWNESFELLKQYQQKYGDCNVPQSYHEDPKLSRWVVGQRYKYHVLSKAQKEKLAGIGFNQRVLRTWEENYELLKQYKQEHGDCYVPEYYPEDPTLRSWVKDLRMRGFRLSESQRNRLEKLNFVFDKANIVQYNERWEKMFKRLQDYKKEYGDCLVPREWAQDQQLAYWVKRQRTMRKKGLMSTERQSKLDSIDFVWQVKKASKQVTSRFDKQWHEQYEKLIAFKEKYDHTMVPKGSEEHKSLGNWVSKQRYMYKKDFLRHDRKKLLENIDFTWNVEKDREVAWNKKCKELKEFYDTHQSSFVGLKTKNPNLYRWLSIQRIYNAKGTLQHKRKAKLDKISDWNIAD